MRFFVIAGILLAAGVAQPPRAQAREIVSRPPASATADFQAGGVAPTAATASQASVGMQPEPDLSAAMPSVARAYWHVFAAFAATFALLFGYAVSVGRRFGRLEAEVRRLRQQ